ncbi:Scd6-like Sm domain-containing protein [Apodospora peruviana]|uniref:Scd6-like Sm domain-containing protein n=1 Tax=Apodospora peruviana TaxID=516989 RepID=A0AAE0HXF1_9PEZI|nr:Scd6-like Sm domain-containing protein [Apodospora peruviana]
MSEFLGARISLISRSDIRYVGTLHEINSDESTVSLENVRSYGTEGRRGNPDDEVAPADQLYEYIVFRGTDVKDLRIEESGPAAKESKPPAVPNDPAIVGARPRPAPGHGAPGPSGPSGPQGLPAPGPGPMGTQPQQGPPFGHFPPPPPYMGGWGRGGPGPEGFNGMQYPPPQWFPPGQQFPPMGPGGPGPWNQYPGPFQPGHGVPPGPPGAPGMPSAPGQPGRQSANHTPSNQAQQQPKPAPIGPVADKKPLTPGQQQKQPEIPSGPKPLGQPSRQEAPATAPPPPVESKPTVEEVKATAASLSTNGPPTAPREAAKTVPTGPKSNRPTQILPAVPLPAALTSKVAIQAQASSSRSASENNAQTAAAALRDATQAARAAVAVAMAKLDGQPAPQPSNGNVMDNLTKKVNEMRVNAPRGGASPNRGARGRGGGGARPAKVEVPDSDFDFASSNAKFNKQDVVKEAIAGSPLTEIHNTETPVPEEVPESADTVLPAYNKTKSFFDNISSEAKDRLENHGQKPGGREWRGEEQRKNMETFGQGSVDGGGYRGYRGRGRGRGGRGGRGFRGGRGGANGAPRSRETQPAAQ